MNLELNRWIFGNETERKAFPEERSRSGFVNIALFDGARAVMQE